MDERTPEPQTSGALAPPPRHPPTAVATAAPLPPRRPTPARIRPSGFRGLVSAAFDAMDRLGDRIADAVGLR